MYNEDVKDWNAQTGTIIIKKNPQINKNAENDPNTCLMKKYGPPALGNNMATSVKQFAKEKFKIPHTNTVMSMTPMEPVDFIIVDIAAKIPAPPIEDMTIVHD